MRFAHRVLALWAKPICVVLALRASPDFRLLAIYGAFFFCAGRAFRKGEIQAWRRKWDMDRFGYVRKDDGQ